MAVRTILQTGNPLLTKRPFPARATGIINKDIQALIDDTIDTLKETGGTGLAASQIGGTTRIIIIQNKGTINSFRKERIPLTVIINPVVVKKSLGKELDWEACLSVNEGTLRGLVPRYKKIEVIGFDRKGKKLTITASGLKARILQHEIDHLECRLFLDRMRKKDYKTLSTHEMWITYHKKNWPKAQSIDE